MSITQPLKDCLVVAPTSWNPQYTHCALVRYFKSLGARITTDLSKLSSASFLVDTVGAAGLKASQTSPQIIAKDYPNLVHVSVSCFGSDGPRAHWQGGELIASAVGGVLRLTGSPDQPPVKEAYDACTFHAKMVAAAGAMAAHYARAKHAAGEKQGRGQFVDVSIQQVALSRNVNGVLGWQFEKRKISRTGGALNYGKATVKCIWELKDGWCFHSLMTGRFGAPANQGLSDWIDESYPDFDNPLHGTDWLAYNRSTLPVQTRKSWEEALSWFFKTRTREDIRTEGQRRKINACVLAEPKEVLEDPHLEAREFWEKNDAGLKLPVRFVSCRADENPVPEAKARSHKETEQSKPRGPLHGVKVLDFSWALVGSFTTKTLGDLGADVIKVESRLRPCLSRMDVQISASSAKSLDDKPWFSHMNTSKKSLSLNMKSPDAMQVLEPLIQWADLVIENFSPGTMDKLGLGYNDLRHINPDVIMVSGSVFGQTGPMAKNWGVDGTGGALSGRTLLTGYENQDPVIPGAVPYGDVIVPYVMAASGIAVLAQKLQSENAGRSVHIDASMYEICVQQMVKSLTDAQHGQSVERTGNADADIYKQDVFPCQGEDRWIAICAPTEADYVALLKMTGGMALADWTETFEAHDLCEMLQSKGVQAGVVADIEDMLEHDPQLKFRRSLYGLSHNELGAFEHIRTPINFSIDEFTPYRSSSIGEHSEEIARGICNFSEAQFKAAQETGLFK